MPTLWLGTQPNVPNSTCNLIGYYMYLYVYYIQSFVWLQGFPEHLADLQGQWYNCKQPTTVGVCAILVRVAVLGGAQVPSPCTHSPSIEVFTQSPVPL